MVANPPFSLKEWGYDLWSNDPYGRKQCGLAPKTNGDFAWVQHMFASLNDNGRMAVVLPHGVLFRGGAEKSNTNKIAERKSHRSDYWCRFQPVLWDWDSCVYFGAAQITPGNV